jgi:uncharacterized membrane protein YuzA (DUF378 family)
VLSWLWGSILCIIWAAFLLPSRRRRSSPISTVEEFERKMTMLAETHRGPQGRWVLMPGKGERLMGARERHRMRVRRRRRVILTGLIELTVLSLIIGLFPPLRPILYATVFFAGVLLVCALVLVKIRSDEARRARARRMRMARRRIAVDSSPVARRAYMARTGSGGPNGSGRHGGNGGDAIRSWNDGLAALGYRANGAHGNGHALNGAGRTGPGSSGVRSAVEFEDEVFGPGSQIIDGDVHVIIRRAADLEDELQAAR